MTIDDASGHRHFRGRLKKFLKNGQKKAFFSSKFWPFETF
jgi:hypothetical protein